MVNIATLIESHCQTIAMIGPMIPTLERIGEEIVTSLRRGGKILLIGNGGSAADAQHLAAEFIGRFQREREPYAALALTTDTSTLTAIANDYGYDAVFARQISGLCRPEDLLIAISTSGNSANIVAAIKVANSLGAVTVGLAGRDGGKLQASAQYCLTVPAAVTARIQEAHIFIGHVLCDLVETSLTKEK